MPANYAVHYMRSLSYPEPVCGITGSCTITADVARVTCAQCVKRAPVTLAAQPEKWLLQQVRALAKLWGWKCYHTHNSKHSEAGFPDVVLCKAPTHGYGFRGRLIFAELKREGETPTIEQQAWLDALATIHGIASYVWRPTDLPHIAALLAQ